MAVSIGSDRGPGAKNSLVSWLKDGVCSGLRAIGQFEDFSFWTQKGARGPRVGGRGGPNEGVGTEVLHDEKAQAEFPESPGILWVLSDLLDDDFGQIVGASSV